MSDKAKKKNNSSNATQEKPSKSIAISTMKQDLQFKMNHPLNDQDDLRITIANTQSLLEYFLTKYQETRSNSPNDLKDTWNYTQIIEYRSD